MRTLNKITLERMEEYIKKYSMEKGISPSYRDIMHSLGMSSLNLVQRYVLALEAQGRIKRTSLGNIDTPRKYDRGESSIVPLVGQIACGQPRFAEENIEESFSLPKGIFGNGKLFMLRAFGDSMIDAGISAGDLLVLRQQDYADEGESSIVPLVGQIACGQPRFAEENIEESFSLPKGIFGNGKLFMLRAFGDSMIDAGISAGDLLVLRQQDYADEGEIVVALVGENATLKRFYKKGRKIILHPENKSMNDIIVDDCQIQGVLVSCIKLY